MQLTFLQHSHDAEGTLVDCTEAQLKDLFTTHKEGLKDGLAFIPGVVDGTRAAENVRELTALVLDCDGMSEASYEAAQRALIASGFAFYAYETHSHAPPDDNRFRAILPFETPCPIQTPEQWKAIRASLLEHLGMSGYVDASTGDPCRLYYLPRHGPGGTQDTNDTWVDGRPKLDWRPFATAEHVPPAKTVPIEVPEAPVDLAAVRDRLSRIRKPRWALVIGRTLKGEALSPYPVDRAKDDPERRVAWRDVTSAMARVWRGEPIEAFTQIWQAAWEAETREAATAGHPLDYTPRDYIVSALERAIAKEPQRRADAKAKDEVLRNTIAASVQTTRSVAQTVSETKELDEKVALPRGQDDFAFEVARFHGHNIRYLTDLRGWRVWDGKRWAPDQNAVFMCIRDITARVRAQKVEDGDAWEKVANRSGNAGYMEGVERLLRALPGICAVQTDFDRALDLLNVQNGTVELRISKLREHRREDMITMICNEGYSEVGGPVTRKFLETILPDVSTREALLSQFGYGITGEVGEQCVFFAVGEGKNGKSQLFGAVKHVLGDYSCVASSALILADPDSSSSERARVRVRGKRFVTIADTGLADSVSMAQIKQQTGEEEVSERRLYAEESSYHPTHKIFLQTNNKPQVNDGDEGTWRRFAVVPFVVRIPQEDRIRSFWKHLVAQEGAGLLGLLIEEARKYYERGLVTSASIQEAQAGYREEEDPLAEFLAHSFELDPEARTYRYEILVAHSEHQALCGRRAWRDRTLYQELRRRFEEIKTGPGLFYFVGLRFKAGCRPAMQLRKKGLVTAPELFRNKSATA